MAVNGNTIQVLVGSDAVGSQRNVTIDRTMEAPDITDKSGRDKKVIAGKRDSTVTCDALYVVGDTAYAALVTEYESATPTGVTLNWNENSGTSTNYRTATAFVTGLSINAASNEAAEMTATFQVSGGWSTP